MDKKYDRIVWIDLEMTGLDPNRDVIVEVAALVTDSQLQPLGDGVDIVIHATPEQLAQMDDFVTQMHASSGLTQEIQASRVSVADAEQRVLDYIGEHVSPEHPAPLAGNSIATDRSFIRAHMPRLDAALHYRMIDVSTLKELARRWHPQVYYHQPEKRMQHRALADITESIRELEYYRLALFPAEEVAADVAAHAQAAATEAFADRLGS